MNLKFVYLILWFLASVNINLCRAQNNKNTSDTTLNNWDSLSIAETNPDVFFQSNKFDSLKTFIFSPQYSVLFRTETQKVNKNDTIVRHISKSNTATETPKHIENNWDSISVDEISSEAPIQINKFDSLRSYILSREYIPVIVSDSINSNIKDEKAISINETSDTSITISLNHDTVTGADSLLVKQQMQLAKQESQKKIIGKKELQKKMLVYALSSFPFPLGFMGAHRVMLGCKPWVPVVYVATFGGCFGILPLIDFIAIVVSKDISEYENNSQLFMWIK